MPLIPRPQASPFLQSIPLVGQFLGQEPSLDPADLVSPVGMAAREPASFLAKKLAGYLKKSGGLIRENADLSKTAIGQFGPSGVESKREYIANVLSGARETDTFLEGLLERIDALGVDEFYRIKDALDLWRLRNLPVGETVKRSTGASDLYQWYRQALERGPYQP